MEGQQTMEEVHATARTSAGLRECLFDAIDMLRRGDLKAGEAKALSGLAKEICRTVDLEIEVERLRSQHPSDSLSTRTLQLG